MELNNRYSLSAFFILHNVSGCQPYPALSKVHLCVCVVNISLYVCITFDYICLPVDGHVGYLLF